MAAGDRTRITRHATRARARRTAALLQRAQERASAIRNTPTTLEFVVNPDARGREGKRHLTGWPWRVVAIQQHPDAPPHAGPPLGQPFAP